MVGELLLPVASVMMGTRGGRQRKYTYAQLSWPLLNPQRGRHTAVLGGVNKTWPPRQEHNKTRLVQPRPLTAS